MDYRALPEAHRDAFHEITSYAFSPESGPDFEERDEDRPRVLEARAVYDVPEGTDASDDLDPSAIRAVCGYYDFTTRLRGGWHAVGAVSAVASPPETRRRGHVAFMLDELLAELRDEGFAFSALWPFEYAFYRRFGWAIGGRWQSLTVDPADLEGAVADPAGSFRRLEQADWEAVDRVYRAWADESFGIRRDELDWQLRYFDSPWRDVYAIGWEDDGGTLRAYCFYEVDEADDEKRLVVYEHGYADDTARRQILRYCRDHDSQVDEVRLTDRELTDLYETLADPRAADVEVHPGPMVRVVDVVAAVAALPVPDSVTGRVVVAVHDDRCAWNDQSFALTFEDGEAVAEPLGDDAVDETLGDEALTGSPPVGSTDVDTPPDEPMLDDPVPDLTLDVGAFSQLVTGCAPLERLRHHEDVTVHDESAVRTLAAAYPEETVYLREGF